MSRIAALLLFTILFGFSGRASHVLGGDITWTCQGGSYVFQLAFYRDCNGAEVNPVSESLEVWGHPTVSNITVNFVSRTDISPLCTEVAGGPNALSCGTGPNGGNGIGAIEKIIYQSAPIALAGTPPPTGWVFTYQNFSRNIAITNLIDPDTKGITITSKMFAIPGTGGGACIDNSPQFLQDPYFVSCAGDPYAYNMNAVDPDLDSLHISFGTPLDHFPGQTYNPPTIPVELQFEPGFSATSPTPGTGMNPGNIPAQIDASSGNLTFLSNNTGNFAVKVIARSYRNGVLIAEVDREIQLVVLNCSGNNNSPVIAGPFGGLFETTINAGDLVNFNLSSTDVELLQDGSPQSNHLSASGLMFGTNLTSTTGCGTTPCATLDATPLITMPQGVTTTFNWQTSCDHLVTPYGETEDFVPYHFVFKVQDDYCPVPKVSYATVTINVVNPGVIQAPNIQCIQSDATGDVTINWDQVNDPVGTFTEYRVYTVQGGLIATIPNIAITSYTDPGITQQNEYYIAVASGCNGNTLKYTDTISNIYLDLNNPSDGTAVLQWNDPINPALAGMNDYYHIYREYPTGTWTLYDSVPYGVNFYRDTITICDVFLNYQIVLPNQPCDYTSNIQGDQFEDMLTPDIPEIYSVTIDSLTGNVIITWNQNAQEDTYGYVVYTTDGNGIVIELDTVWGITNTSYVHSTNTDNGPLTYSVAAFDSCWTPVVPPTYQTSAKAPVHTTIFTTSSLNICDRTVSLNWTPYGGWDDLDRYEIYMFTTGQPWSNIGSATDTSFSTNVEDGKNYCFLVKAVSLSGDESFSNRSCILVSTPDPPSFHYLQVATVLDEEIHLRHYIDATNNTPEVSIQRKDESGAFVEIARIPVTSSNLSYIDTDVDVQGRSYTYRVQVVDSCFQLGAISNEAQTILLRTHNDDVAKINYIQWSPYREFDGAILGYNLYRGIDGNFPATPHATLAANQWSYEDDVNGIVSNGKICYYVEVIEAINSYNFSEISRSNERCVILPPLVYVPNAFTPEGNNPIFIPVVSDFDPTDYDFRVFNRWGQVIFQTNDYTQGWDGNIKGSNNLAQTGVYLYMVTLKDGQGIEIVKRGHVSLLK